MYISLLLTESVWGVHQLSPGHGLGFTISKSHQLSIVCDTLHKPPIQTKLWFCCGCNNQGITLDKYSSINAIINPRRACAARVTVLGLCVCVSVCLCVCLSPLILALQGSSRLISDTNGSSTTKARKVMWRFCLNGGVRELWR